MDIIFRTSKLEKEFNDRNLLQKRQGQIRAKLIHRRLDDLRAAEVLEYMRNIPGRCHEVAIVPNSYLWISMALIASFLRLPTIQYREKQMVDSTGLK